MLELNGTIAEESWFDDDVTPQMFKDELFSGNGPVTVWLNSPGGDCIAASAGSVIAMAGTKVLMSPTALVMIHNPATTAFGDHKDMSKAIDMLDEVKESIINAYEIRTGLSHTQLSHMMDEETWMNAKKAIELGFADGLLEDNKNTEDDEGYMFSASAVERTLINKITKKNPINNVGRNVDKLKSQLYKKLL